MTTQPCDDDGLETDGRPRNDEPTDPDPQAANFDYQADDFAPLPEDEEATDA